MAEYTELKDQIKGLIENLEGISAEAKSYAETSDILSALAEKMTETCDSLSKIIEQSSEIYQHVNDASVKKTLDSFKHSAEAFELQAKAMTEEIKFAQRTVISEVKSSNESVMSKTVEKLEDITNMISKKVMIMGGVSVFCSIVAIVIAIVL